jgi:predicted PurR-regulated permease PerM
MDEERPEARSVDVRLRPGEVARASLVVLAIGVGAFVLWTLREVIFLMFVAVLIAVAVEPLVLRLRRGPFNRAAGVLIVFGGIVLAIGLPSYFLIPAVLAQVQEFANGFPERLETLRPYAEGLQAPLRAAALNAIDYGGQLVRTREAPRDERLVAAGASALETLLSVVTVLVLAFYWLLERGAIRRRLAAASQADKRTVYTIWWEIEEKLGGWVRGQLMLMGTVGVLAAVGYMLIGLPSPLLLALIAALGELVPVIGPILAFSPAVLAGLTISPATALVVLVFVVVLEQLEAYVLAPRLMAHTVGVSPLTVVIGLLAGYTLFGLAGAVVAVPVAGALQVLIAHALGEEPPIEKGPAEAPPIDGTASRK